MLRVPIEQAKSGMVLARSIINPEKTDHILLKAGYKLDSEFIGKLRTLHIGNIWIQYPGLDFLDDEIDPETVRKQQKLYDSLKEDFTKAQGQGLNKIDYGKYVRQMTGLFQSILAKNKTSASFISELRGSSGDIFLHSTTVASIALLIGIRLEHVLVKARPIVSANMATDLTNLGVGCLLHDIGKLSLPDELQGFHLTAQNLGSAEWQQHTEAGYEAIKAGLNPCAGQIILNHHQHFDGSGFPLRKKVTSESEPVFPLKGEEIHVFCRIACIADRFDGFRYLPDGKVAPTVVALKRMRNPGYAKWFDPAIYKAFTDAMPAFNPGDQVILNDSQIVVVTEVNDGEPCRPVVRPIDMDKAEKPDKSSGEVEEPVDINLAARPDLYIAKVGDFDVTPYLH